MASRPRQWLDYALLRVLFALAGRLPRRWALAWGRALGSFVWSVVRFRRGIVVDNIRRSDLELPDERAVRELGRAFYRNLGMTLMEFLRLPRLRPGEIEELVEIEGGEHLATAAAEGPGAIFVSAHFGNWEYAGARLAALDVPISFVAKTQHNARVDGLQNAIRARAGVGIVRTGAPVKELIRALRRGECIAMLADQDAGPDGVFTSFLGRATSVLRGAGYLTRKLGVPMATGYCFRRPDGRHRLVIDGIVRPDRNLDEAADVRRLTEHHARRLEDAVRRAPDHFYWVHRRWKTRPPEETT